MHKQAFEKLRKLAWVKISREVIYPQVQKAP
jgi:hypothetical protein